MHRWKMFDIALSWWDSMYGGNYLRVGVKDPIEGTTSQEHSCDFHHCVKDKSVRTGKSDHLIKFTDNMGDIQICTEWQSYHQ